MRAGQGPVKPGETDVIDVYIDTAGKRGTFAKMVTVNTNDPGRSSVVIQFRATVLPPSSP